MADVSLIQFIPGNKKLAASALYNDELLENSFLDKVCNNSQGTIENTKRFRWKCRYDNYYQQVKSAHLTCMI